MIDFENPFEYRLIYCFTIHDRDHEGKIKIGETTLKSDAAPDQPSMEAAARKRIDQYTRTAAIQYELLHVEIAVDNRNETFSDHDVHRVLQNSSIKRAEFAHSDSREWFEINLDTARRAIQAVKLGRENLSGLYSTGATDSRTASPIDKIIFRPEQNDAIAKAIKFFRRKTPERVLWNAKMRFGKTLCALEVVRRCEFKRTIIVTHRPVVKSGWFEDFRKIFDGTPYRYGSKSNGESASNLDASDAPFVYFSSIQDLRGSKTVGGNFDKNSDVFSIDWDLLIVDEAHEGTQTTLGDKVISTLIKSGTRVLMLSGTPFILAAEFDDERTFTWTYVDEQRAKINFDRTQPLEHNPYVDLPTLNIRTYDLGRLIQSDRFVDIKDKAFDFFEFFRVEDDQFVHDDAVHHFLDMISRQSKFTNFPFANRKFRNMFHHTLWILPRRNSARALCRMLEAHRVFKNFSIVNVSDDEVIEGDALGKVRAAIAHNDWTITLSCGRLTSGVTVPEWTAVLMLTDTTSTTFYMQTIFRVQSPCKVGGRLKTECFVFDFAPDRALQVIANVSTSAHSREGARELFGEFLNFAPVIAFDGSRMTDYNIDKFFRQLKHAYSDAVVNSGFDSAFLFNENIRDADPMIFRALKKILGSASSERRIVINEQGFNRKQSSETRRRGSSVDQKKINASMIRMLRAVSTRLPLMIYGANVRDEQITVERITDIIDDRSWEEFMPRGLSKELFRALVPFYDRDVFADAAQRIRDAVRAVDKLSPPKRVQAIAELFATFKNPDKETVLTPWRVVNEHLCSTLGGLNFVEPKRGFEYINDVTGKIFKPDARVLDINSKTGLYSLHIACSIWERRVRNEMVWNFDRPLDFAAEQKLWRQTVAENIYALCRTPMAAAITRRTLLGFDTLAHDNIRVLEDVVEQLRADFDRQDFSEFVLEIKSVSFWRKGGRGTVKFDAVVGNPPYQQETGKDTREPPVYHYFIEAVQAIAARATLIHPARFLFNAGATPTKFNQKFLSDRHWKVVSLELDSRKLFPANDVKGGIAITYYDADKDFGTFDIFIPFTELRSLHQKVVVDNKNFEPLSSIIFTKSAYHLTEKLHADHPDAAARMSAGHAYDVTTNIFERLPDIFTLKKPDDGREYSLVMGLYRTKRTHRWCRRDYLTEPQNFTKYKVLVPAANGSGAIGETLSSPLVGSPLVSHTETFLTVGSFDSITEAESACKYIKTKFCRAMLGILKVTQHNPPATWAKVPLQNFTSRSDIDWSRSVAEIDRQLYSKYGLTTAEIAFIEEKVRAMK